MASSLKASFDNDLDAWSMIHSPIDYHPNPNGFYQSDDWEIDLPYFYEVHKGGLIKIVRGCLNLVPRGHYRLIFMTRKPAEIIASMRRFTPFLPWGPAERNVYLYDLVKNATIKQLLERGDYEILEVSYNDVVKNPLPEFEKIRAFGFPIDAKKAASLVDESLHRLRL